MDYNVLCNTRKRRVNGEYYGGKLVGNAYSFIPHKIYPHAENKYRADKREVRQRRARHNGLDKMRKSGYQPPANAATGIAEKMQPLPREQVITIIIMKSGIAFVTST